MAPITELIARMHAGDPHARDALFDTTYGELRRLARSRLKNGGRNTVLDTTALVHECYLRFVKVGDLRVEDRRAFFGYASRAMRSVIVDSARERLAERRGGAIEDLTLEPHIAEGMQHGAQEILDVHEALLALEQADERLARVVEMRYFGGYNDREIGEALAIADRTVQRDWEKARAILSVALGQTN